VVLGGGAGNIQQVKKHVFNNHLDTFILKPKPGDTAGVFGGVLLK